MYESSECFHKPFFTLFGQDHFLWEAYINLFKPVQFSQTTSVNMTDQSSTVRMFTLVGTKRSSETDLKCYFIYINNNFIVFVPVWSVLRYFKHCCIHWSCTVLQSFIPCQLKCWRFLKTNYVIDNLMLYSWLTLMIFVDFAELNPTNMFIN